MSDYAETARLLIDLLAPYCERIEIAGSVRRGKPNPKDIELVMVPRVETVSVQVDMFNTEDQRVNVLDCELAVWKANGRLRDRPDKAGRPCWGERTKRAVLVRGAEEIPLDLFSVLPPAQFGAIMVIRTGPEEFSKRLVTQRAHGGLMPAGYRQHEGALWAGGQIIETPDEETYFEAIGLDWICPEMRA